MNPFQLKELSDFENDELFDSVFKYVREFIGAIKSHDTFPNQDGINELRVFETTLSENGLESKKVIESLIKTGAKGIVNNYSGKYFGFVNGSSLPVSLAANMIGVLWDQNAALNVMSPLVARLEEVVESWLLDLLQLPSTSRVGFLSGASSANLCALAAARHRILSNLGWDVKKLGLRNSPPVRFFVPKGGHLSIEKAIGILGYGANDIEYLDVDTEGRVSFENLPTMDESCILILQAGQVNTGAFDYFHTIIPYAKKFNAWVHIDGAFGLWDRVITESDLTKGIELADSWTVDAHKSLNQPNDSGIIICSDPEALNAALAADASYVQKSNDFNKRGDGMMYTDQMSRRGRVIELWAALSSLGKSGVAELIQTLKDNASYFSIKMESVSELKVLNKVVFNQVLLAVDASKNQEVDMKKIVRSIQDKGTCWVGGAMWKNQDVMRVSFTSWTTDENDIDELVEEIKSLLL